MFVCGGVWGGGTTPCHSKRGGAGRGRRGKAVLRGMTPGEYRGWQHVCIRLEVGWCNLGARSGLAPRRWTVMISCLKSRLNSLTSPRIWTGWWDSGASDRPARGAPEGSSPPLARQKALLLSPRHSLPP